MSEQVCSAHSSPFCQHEVSEITHLPVCLCTSRKEQAVPRPRLLTLPGQSQDPHPAAHEGTTLPSQCLQWLAPMSTKCSSHLIKINEKTTDFWEGSQGISSSSAEGISLCMGHAGDGKVICTYKSHSCSLNSCRLRAGKEAKITDCQTILTWYWQWADCQGT